MAARPAHVIDVGCAEGYYAVGLALAIPGTHVHAYDIDVQARVRCAELAQQNAVAGRVSIHSECAPGDARGFPEQGVVLLSDCEGYERTLLDPALAPRLKRWPMLVELHDFLDPSISRTIAERFAPTHEIEIVEGEPRDPDGVPELDFMTPRQRRAVLSDAARADALGRMDPRDGYVRMDAVDLSSTATSDVSRRARSGFLPTRVRIARAFERRTAIINNAHDHPDAERWAGQLRRESRRVVLRRGPHRGALSVGVRPRQIGARPIRRLGTGHGHRPRTGLARPLGR